MYNYLLRSFAPGTSSICKQALGNLLLKIAERGPHVCKRNPVLKPASMDTVRTVDSLVYIEDYKIFKIESVHGSVLTCKRLHFKKFLYVTTEDTEIPFHEIGVFGSHVSTEDESVDELVIDDEVKSI